MTKPRLITVLMLLLLAFAAVPTVYGNTINVTNGGDPGGGPQNGDGCTLREAIENAGDNAQTWPDCTAGSPGVDTITFSVSQVNLVADSAFTGEIFIIEDLIINQAVIIDGGDETRMFRIAGGADVTLQNVTMQNGFTAGAGGAILIDNGNLTLVNCNFKDNVAEGHAGAIYDNGNDIDITNCNFENNTAGSDGGAIYGNGVSTFNINASKFVNNTADGSGGAITLAGTGNNPSGTITATMFKDNKAKGDAETEGGGAIMFRNGAIYNVLASAFAGNQATGDDGRGGAVFIAAGGYVLIEYSHFGTTPIPLPPPFDSLTAANEVKGPGGMGGAIYNRDTMGVIGSSFIGNKSTNHGGAIANDAPDDYEAFIANSTIHGNEAANNGGGIYQFNPSTFREITLINTTISANTAASGGGIYNNSSTVTLQNTIISNNTGNNCAGSNVTNQAGNVVFGGACPANTAIFNGDPKLQALELTFSLGAIVTYSRALGGGSAASGLGDQSICDVAPILNLDQRGLPRPIGQPNCDAGSVEGSGASEITVVKPGPEDVPDGGAVDFGTTALEAPLTIVFTVINDGADPLVLGGLSAPPAGFSFTDFGSSVIAGGGTTTFSITCEAEAAGDYSGSVSFSTNDSNENPFNFDIDCNVSNATATPTATNTPTPTPNDAEQTATAGGPTLTPTASNTPTITLTPTQTYTPGGPTVTPTSTPLIIGVELLLNNGFEAKDLDAKPDLLPWTVKNPVGDKIKCNKDKDGDGLPDKIFARTGSCAFQFKGAAGENSKLAQNADIAAVTFTAGDSLDLRLYYKATNAALNGKVKLRIKFGDDTDTGKINFDLTQTGEDYAEVFQSIIVASSAVDKIKVQVQNKSAAGKIYVDDASLRWVQAVRDEFGITNGLGNSGGLIPLPGARQ